MPRKSRPFAPPVPRRRLGATLLLAACAATAAPAAVRAQAVTLNFNSLTVTDGSGIRYVNNCYQESGFQIAAVGLACGTPYVFATAGAADPTTYTGSPALFLNDPTATLVSFSRIGGGLFSMQSIGLASFLGSSATVTFTGFRTGAANVTQTCNVAAGPAFGAPPLGVCALGATFTGLTSLQLAAVNSFGEPIVQFDNVVVTPAATVPEPSTVALVAGGLAGLAAAARRRRGPLTPNAA